MKTDFVVYSNDFIVTDIKKVKVVYVMQRLV